MADAIAVFMDTEGLAGATVLGHSMGGSGDGAVDGTA